VQELNIMLSSFKKYCLFCFFFNEEIVCLLSMRCSLDLSLNENKVRYLSLLCFPHSSVFLLSVFCVVLVFFIPYGVRDSLNIVDSFCCVRTHLSFDKKHIITYTGCPEKVPLVKKSQHDPYHDVCITFYDFFVCLSGVYNDSSLSSGFDG